MSEDVKENEPVQQESVQQSQKPAESKTETPVVDWEKRYKGSVTKINELTASIKDLNDQLGSKTSEIEQLKAQLTNKDIEKDASVSEHKKLLEQALSNKTHMESELTELRAMKTKLDLVKELDAKELIPILDRIPVVDDPDAMRTVMEDFKKWGDELRSEREKELLSGEYSAPASDVQGRIAEPQSADEWEAYINNLPFGSEREQAWEKYWKWGAAQQS
jgi:uncharacterized small protein (DUF1192 family)